jgi:adenylate cyclase
MNCRFFLIATLLISGLCFPLGVNAQAKRVNDLRERLILMENDTPKVKVLLKLAYQMSRTRPAIAFFYAQQAWELSEKLNYPAGLSDALSSMGDCKVYQGVYGEALQYFTRALDIREASGDSLGMARSFSNIGQVYYYYSHYAEAMPYHLRALRIRLRYNDSSAIAHSYLTIGIVEESMGNYEAALDYYDIGYPYAEKTGSLRMMAAYYNYIGRAWRKLGNYSQAMIAHEKSKTYLDQIDDPLGIARFYNNLGSIYRRQGEYRKALSHFFRANQIQTSLNDREGLADGNIDMGRTYSQLGIYDSALYYANRGLEIAKNTGLRDDMRYGYSVLSEIYESMGDYQQGLTFTKKYEGMRDSLFSQEMSEELKLAQLMHERELRQQEMSMAQKDRALERARMQRVLVYVGSSALLLLVFAGFTYDRYRRRTRANRELAEKNEEIDLERRRSDALLLNILPEQTAEELKMTGKTAPRSYPEVTVMFTDFVGFTQISERLSPEELVHELDYCFRVYDQIVDEYGVEKIKTIGDAYMAVSGLPLSSPSHAQNAVAAALAIQDFMRGLKETRQLQGKPFFEVRVGVHTGPVVAGVVGRKKFAYDVWGDTVNTAARLEGASEAGKVNISQTTFSLVKEEFGCEYRGKVSVKNKGEIDMYFVTNRKRKA